MFAFYFILFLELKIEFEGFLKTVRFGISLKHLVINGNDNTNNDFTKLIYNLFKET